MARLSQTLKQKRAAQDKSHLMQETWGELASNALMVVLTAMTVWLFCSGLEHLVKHFSYNLFGWSAKKSVVFNPWLLFAVMVLGGLVRGLLIARPKWRDSEGDGATRSISYFHETYEDVEDIRQAVKKRYSRETFVHAVRKVIVTLLTLGTGGSGGLEGPVIPIGESVGAGYSKKFGIKMPDDLRVFQMAGIAAAITTLLSAPLTAAVFAAEIVFADRLVYRPLLYSLIAAIVAYELNHLFFAPLPLFSAEMHVQTYSIREYIEVSLVAIFCSAPAGLGVNVVLHQLQKLFARLPLVIRAPVGMICAGSIALGLWFWLGLEPYHVLGAGEITIQSVFTGVEDKLLAVWWVLFLLVGAKIFTTGFTLMSGGSAGLLIPAMVLGGMMGAGTYHGLTELGLTGIDSGVNLFVISGIASALVAVIEVPLAAIVLVMEIFGSSFGPPAIVAVVICHKFVKRFRLYFEK